MNANLSPAVRELLKYHITEKALSFPQKAKNFFAEKLLDSETKTPVLTANQMQALLEKAYNTSSWAEYEHQVRRFVRHQMQRDMRKDGNTWMRIGADLENFFLYPLTDAIWEQLIKEILAGLQENDLGEVAELDQLQLQDMPVEFADELKLLISKRLLGTIHTLSRIQSDKQIREKHNAFKEIYHA